MKIPQDVRGYAAKQKEIEVGMQEKSAEFRERGGEVYVPVAQVATMAGADAEETVAADWRPRRVHRNVGSTNWCSPRRAL